MMTMSLKNKMNCFLHDISTQSRASNIALNSAENIEDLSGSLDLCSPSGTAAAAATLYVYCIFLLFKKSRIEILKNLL